jgi:hypothetical protein
MSQIIEVLYHIEGTYVVDNTSNNVTVTAITGTFFQNASNYTFFAAGDNFEILSISSVIDFFAIPYTNGSPVAIAPFYWIGNYYSLSSAPQQGFYLPFVNYEMSLGVFEEVRLMYKTFSLNPSKFQLTAVSNMGYVNCLGVPSGLNGKTGYITTYLKILHNNPMTAS